ncbi:MAG TPA: hypothetical protein VGF95_10970 [Solirubrobacteraceae bacterium]|jgi:hypothetical protein
MSAKACILCGAIPPPPLTGEHIWPDWYNRQQPGFRYELESVVDSEVSVRPTPSMNLKPKVLCESCNSGWGSDLEKRIGPILTPMIHGEACRLGSREIQIISAWFFLKCMVSECLVPASTHPQRFFDLNDGRHLKATLEPPAGVVIWIGQYVGSRSDAGWVTGRNTRRRWQISTDPAAGIHWHSVTYSIGQVLLHLFAVTDPVLFASGSWELKEPVFVEGNIPIAPGNWATGLSRIWEPPSGAVSWPPEKAFDDKHFVYLADRWQSKQPPRAEPSSEVVNAPE